MMPCKECNHFDGFVNLYCQVCGVHLNALKKSENFNRVVYFKPNEEEINIFKKLYEEANP